jgi:hypothetical protein
MNNQVMRCYDILLQNCIESEKEGRGEPGYHIKNENP